MRVLPSVAVVFLVASGLVMASEPIRCPERKGVSRPHRAVVPMVLEAVPGRDVGHGGRSLSAEHDPADWEGLHRIRRTLRQQCGPALAAVGTQLAVLHPKGQCCKVCSSGKACGDTCISRSKNRRKGRGDTRRCEPA